MINKEEREHIKQLKKEKENSYWQGFIKKQQESVEICKICKYRDKYRQLEAELSKANNTINQYKEREQNIVKYLEQEINVNRVQHTTLNENIKSEMIKSKYVDRKVYAREILKMMKGENKMGMKIAIIETENNKAKRIDYFENDTKGIGDFITLLNEKLSKNNYSIRISKVKRRKE